MTSYSVPELRDRLKLLDDRITAAEKAVEAAQRRLMQAQTERAGAEAFINMLESADAADATESQQSSTSPFVLAALRTDPEGVRLEDVPRIVVEQGGPELSGEQVRSSVKHLRKRGEVENVRRGLWRAKMDIPRNTDGPAEAGPSDETSPRLTPVVNAG